LPRYLNADYDRRNFLISQRSWTPNAQQDIKTILPPSNSSSNSITPAESQKSHGLGAGAIAGIAIAAVLILLGATLLFIYFKILKPRRAKKAAELEASAAPEETEVQPDEIDPMFKPELEGQGKTELEGQGTKGNQGEVHETDGTAKHEMYSAEQVMEMEANRSGQIFELPAKEEVASELMGLGNSSELEDNERRRVQLHDSPWSQEEKWEGISIPTHANRPPTSATQTHNIKAF
jgi:hypothetical protein